MSRAKKGLSINGTPGNKSFVNIADLVAVMKLRHPSRAAPSRPTLARHPGAGLLQEGAILSSGSVIRRKSYEILGGCR
ncbi:hypothetical protein SS37A_22240 [Methylocystis iwaonis]|uniref:Uncharacterized protein n=1 Tax=Methylocystis iwaonis TaxID=2885079 RepID=A0ABN6VG68_9HYPH|nr:hypothetical protein SS37A_22240 [Methylocystis iwaonis]